jgi:mRNA-degrading endonuclease RelE of RelBE toxin-antitoxin system
MMRLWVAPAALDEIAALPGHVRQRIRRSVSDLPKTPRPTNSHALEIPADMHIAGLEAHRLRIDSWRVLYVIDQEWEIITVLAVRKRLSCNYEDLRELLGRV